MSLIVENRIYVPTYNGEKEIQLCLGDITMLPVEDKVDVILVSALPGDYTPTRRSVIGALWRNLNLSVRQLYSSHTENYMKTCSCWVSHNLPAHLPYRKLMCWENFNCSRVDQETLSSLMRELFRALMPVFNTANSSVITPLLGSGIQSIKPDMILEAMVDSAAAWMRMGLPLQKLKIVVYTRVEKSQLGPQEQQCIQLFSKLKKKHEEQVLIPKDPKPDFDIFMIYCEKDELVINVRDRITGMDKSIRLKSWKEVQSQESTWQHNMYNTMLQCNRIVPFLTSSYMNNKECVDLYNIALCCNRRTRRNILTPLMLENMLNIPGYMKMVQWLDARTPEKHPTACSSLLEQIKEGEKTGKYNYDIFISYSHKSPQEANKLLAAFQKKDPNLKIFFDYEELKSGVSWQQALYKAIDGSHCVVALLTQTYFESPVCTEEFNLSLAKHLTEEKPLELIPVCVQPVDLSDKTWLRNANPAKAYEKDVDAFIDGLTDSVIHWLKSGDKKDYFIDAQERLILEKLTSPKRAEIFQKNYHFHSGQVTLKSIEKVDSKTNESNYSSSDNCDVLFSYALRDQKYVQLIKQFLINSNPQLKLVDSARSENEQNHHLETAKSIVVLLSPSYLQSKKEIGELDVIINRERASKNQRILYTVQLNMLPAKPTYVRLLPCDTCLVDDFWKDIVQEAATENGLSFGSTIDEIRQTIEKEWDRFRDEEIVAALKICCDITAATDDSIKPMNIHDDVILCNITELQNTESNTVNTNQANTEESLKQEQSTETKESQLTSPSKNDKGAAITKQSSAQITDTKGATTTNAKDQSQTRNHQKVVRTQACSII